MSFGAKNSDQMLTVSFSDLMALAKRLIGEHLDDCGEEFLAGRAHGIGSLHSEILSLAKNGMPSQAIADAGVPAKCTKAITLEENMLSTALWLYRRLPPGYGRLEVIEGPIRTLAQKIGRDVAACFAERGTDPAASIEKN